MAGEVQDQVQHVYHHYDNDAIRVNVSFEQNSRGVNFSATVVNAKSVAEAILQLRDAKEALSTLFPVSKVEIETEDKTKKKEK